MTITITPEIFIQVMKNKEVRLEREKAEAAAKMQAPDVVVSNSHTKIIYSNNFLKSVEFAEPNRLDTAIFVLKNNAKISDEIFLLNGRVFKNLVQLGKEISKSSEFEDVKVKSLLGLGKNSIVFETEDGKALKFSNGNQFKDGREIQPFDIPVEKSGKVLPDGNFYYYYEEKATQGDINKSEVKTLLKRMKELGYRLVDYRNEDLYCGAINFSQFGRGKNGAVYLLDHECAVKAVGMDVVKSFLKTLFRLW